MSYEEQSPSVVRVLTAIQGAARQHLGSDLISLMIGGSVATGDVAVSADGVFSDIDGLAVVKRRRDTRAFEHDLREIEARERTSELFYCDISVISAADFARLPQTFQHVEMGAAAIVLAGADLRPYLPRRVAPQSSRASFLLNLWKSIFFRQKVLTSTAGAAYQQAVARQVLDLPIVAFAERGQCPPGHRNRVEMLLRGEAGFLPPPHVAEALRAAVAVRQGRSVDTRVMDPLSVARYTLELLDHAPAPQGDATTATVRRLRRLLPRRSIRRFVGEAVSGRRHPLWLLSRKEAMAGAVGLAILEFMDRECVGQPPREAGRFLEFMSGHRIGGEGYEFLAAARTAYWASLLLQYPTLVKHDERMRRVLGAVCAKP